MGEEVGGWELAVKHVGQAIIFMLRRSLQVGTYINR
jgi:hypothetical protein